MPANVQPGERISGLVLESELMELSLLLPSWQVTALDSLAKTQGLSIGQMIRRTITTLVTESALRPAAP